MTSRLLPQGRASVCSFQSSNELSSADTTWFTWQEQRQQGMQKITRMRRNHQKPFNLRHVCVLFKIRITICQNFYFASRVCDWVAKESILLLICELHVPNKMLVFAGDLSSKHPKSLCNLQGQQRRGRDGIPKVGRQSLQILDQLHQPLCPLSTVERSGLRTPTVVGNEIPKKMDEYLLIPDVFSIG